MKQVKKAIMILSACLLAAACTFPAFASEKIEDITLEIHSSIRSGDAGSDSEVTVEVDNEGCYVDSVKVTNAPSGEWDDDDKPKIKITLATDDDYIFASGIKKDDVALDSEDGTVTSVSRSSSSKLVINVTLVSLDEVDDDDDDDDYDLDVSDPIWDDSENGMAYWDECDDAKKYQVRLYRDGSAVTETLSTESGSYNFASYFTKAGTYTFRVRGYRSSTYTGSWQESDELTVTSSEASTIYANRNANSSSSSNSSNSTTSGTSNTSGTVNSSSSATDGAWLKDSNGLWWWCNPDRTYPANMWKLINGSWYYFNANGYCEMNKWIETDGKWYYCGSSGAMLTSQLIDGKYWVNSNGVWVQ